MSHHHGHQHDTERPTDNGATAAALVQLLDLDGMALHSYWTDALTWVQRAAAGTSFERILDLGAGTGNGAIALAQRFPSAEVIAVDSAEDMLKRIRDKAASVGLADRIRTVQADLDVRWPEVDSVDVTWASMSMHHLSDPDRALGQVYASTRPGGLVAVAEFAEPLRFLPHDIGLGRPGLEERCLAALATEHAQSLPDLGSDWSSRLAAAGFMLVSERTFTIELNPPIGSVAARYAQCWLQRLRSGFGEQLAADDLETLGILVDGDGPESVQHRDDLQIRGSRTVTLARRP
jgi:ubiquinone/menaquinone biosynthesis C-methylase UbiE